jgi:hypothetical protein
VKPRHTIAEPEQHTPLLRRRYFPMGYPLEILTSSPDAISAADTLWGPFEQLSDVPPVRLRIDVSQFDALLAPIPVMPCHFGHLLAIVQGPENFGVADMAAGYGVICVSRDVAQNPSWFIYHFLEPIACVLLGARHFTMLHAACVALDGKAVLLSGPSGAGKTCLSYACATRGWHFITGDAAHLVRDSPEVTIIGRPFSIRFRDSAKSMFPSLGRYRARLRPNGKRDIEINTSELRLSTALHARATLVVFLNRAADPVQAGFDVVSRNDAKSLLADSICFGDEFCRAEQATAMERLLDLPLLRLTYSDPFGAEALLRSALEGGV